ncbi:unnamed protein product [Closterium sp. Naga37s-1]|nr:unnamed protein product [Closterium sp. Naga37s-1]
MPQISPELAETAKRLHEARTKVYNLAAWTKVYNLADDTTRSPSPLSFPPDVPPAPHLEDCTAKTALRVKAEATLHYNSSPPFPTLSHPPHPPHPSPSLPTLPQSWTKVYNLADDTTRSPAPLSFPPDVPPAPHLEDCTAKTALRVKAEARGPHGEDPDAHPLFPSSPLPLFPSPLPFLLFTQPPPGKPQIRGSDAANLALTRVFQRDLWERQFPASCAGRRLMITDWPPKHHGTGSMGHVMGRSAQVRGGRVGGQSVLGRESAHQTPPKAPPKHHPPSTEPPSKHHGTGSMGHVMGSFLNAAVRHNRTLVIRPRTFHRASGQECSGGKGGEGVGGYRTGGEYKEGNGYIGQEGEWECYFFPVASPDCLKLALAAESAAPIALHRAGGRVGVLLLPRRLPRLPQARPGSQSSSSTHCSLHHSPPVPPLPSLFPLHTTDIGQEGEWECYFFPVASPDCLKLALAAKAAAAPIALFTTEGEWECYFFPVASPDCLKVALAAEAAAPIALFNDTKETVLASATQVVICNDTHYHHDAARAARWVRANQEAAEAAAPIALFNDTKETVLASATQVVICNDTQSCQIWSILSQSRNFLFPASLHSTPSFSSPPCHPLTHSCSLWVAPDGRPPELEHPLWVAPDGRPPELEHPLWVAPDGRPPELEHPLWVAPDGRPPELEHPLWVAPDGRPPELEHPFTIKHTRPTPSRPSRPSHLPLPSMSLWVAPDGKPPELEHPFTIEQLGRIWVPNDNHIGERWWRSQTARFLMRWPSALLCHITNRVRHNTYGMAVAERVVAATAKQQSILHSTPPNTPESQHLNSLPDASSAVPPSVAYKSSLAGTVWQMKGFAGCVGTRCNESEACAGAGSVNAGGGAAVEFSSLQDEPFIFRPYVSLHVRLSDKYLEMKLHFFATYMYFMYKLRAHVPNLEHVWLSTEMQSAIEETSNFPDWTFHYTTSGRVTSATQMQEEHVNDKQRTGEIFANLIITTQADYFVGALASNWNRLIDELRSTNGRLYSGHVALNEAWT